jgi:hypothetical protein
MMLSVNNIIVLLVNKKTDSLMHPTSQVKWLSCWKVRSPNHTNNHVLLRHFHYYTETVREQKNNKNKEKRDTVRYCMILTFLYIRNCSRVSRKFFDLDTPAINFVLVDRKAILYYYYIMFDFFFFFFVVVVTLSAPFLFGVGEYSNC